MNGPEINQGGGYFPIPNPERYDNVQVKLDSVLSRFGMVVEGRDNLYSLARREGGNGVIIASTHDSWMDIAVLGAANDAARMRFLGKAEVWNWPYIGKLAVDAGAFSVNRQHQDSRHAAIDTTVKMLDNGEWVTMYIEGTRNRSKEGRTMGKIKTGVARAALQASGVTPILPVAIGYRRSLVRRSPSIRKPVIIFGEPDFIHQGPADSRIVSELTESIGEKLLLVKNRAMDIVEGKV